MKQMRKVTRLRSELQAQKALIADLAKDVEELAFELAVQLDAPPERNPWTEMLEAARHTPAQPVAPVDPDVLLCARSSCRRPISTERDVVQVAHLGDGEYLVYHIHCAPQARPQQ